MNLESSLKLFYVRGFSYRKRGDFMNYLSFSNNLSFYSSFGFSSRFMEPSSMMGNSNQMGMGRLANGGQMTGQSGTAWSVNGKPVQAGMEGIANDSQIPGQLGTKRPANGRQVQPDVDTYECQTCKNRKYQDGSDDPGVSFKMPTRISPEAAPYAIRAHESEHVAHAWAEAQREDKEDVSQSDSYHTDICPECGKSYMSGGTTRTVFRSAPETYSEPPAQKGAYVDLVA